MPKFAFFKCTNPNCQLRFPLDEGIHRGEFCPRCGGTLHKVASQVDELFADPNHSIPSRRISGLLDNIRSGFNVGGIFRTADGAGLEHLYLCGITPTPEAHPAMAKTALGAENSIPWSSHANALSVAENLRKQGVFLLALEQTAESIPLFDFSLDGLGNQPIALIIGHERAGVDPGLLGLCDGIIALPMVGCKASLNVAVAFGAAVYWLAFH